MWWNLESLTILKTPHTAFSPTIFYATLYPSIEDLKSPSIKLNVFLKTGNLKRKTPHKNFLVQDLSSFPDSLPDLNPHPSPYKQSRICTERPHPGGRDRTTYPTTSNDTPGRAQESPGPLTLVVTPNLWTGGSRSTGRRTRDDEGKGDQR